MIKLLAIDLDGVLADIKDLHFKSLNMAISDTIGPQYQIDYKTHISTYDGLPTIKKLGMISDKYHLNLSEFVINNINLVKQRITLELLDEIKPNQRLIDDLERLEKECFIVCCSNSVTKTIEKVLTNLGIINCFDNIYSNEDVMYPKPNPQIYLQPMADYGYGPDEVLIIEDSPKGIEAARCSGAHVLVVKNTSETNYENIMSKIQEIDGTGKNIGAKYSNTKLNIVIPMAGLGSRFEKAGYSFPKPLIDVGGKTMIQAVVDSLNIEANYIFICQKEHYEKYNLGCLLPLIGGPTTKIIQIDGLTKGAAITVKFAEKFINNDNPVLIVNSDQLVEWNPNEFFYKAESFNWDGGILTFTSFHPQWSFVRLDEEENVVELAEKKVISSKATIGVYWLRKGSDAIKYINQMVVKDIRTNNEFYFAPCYNEAIADGKKIGVFDAGMVGLGNPELLEKYLNKGK